MHMLNIIILKINGNNGAIALSTKLRVKIKGNAVHHESKAIFHFGARTVVDWAGSENQNSMPCW